MALRYRSSKLLKKRKPKAGSQEESNEVTTEATSTSIPANKTHSKQKIYPISNQRSKLLTDTAPTQSRLLPPFQLDTTLDLPFSSSPSPFQTKQPPPPPQYSTNPRINDIAIQNRRNHRRSRSFSEILSPSNTHNFNHGYRNEPWRSGETWKALHDPSVTSGLENDARRKESVLDRGYGWRNENPLGTFNKFHVEHSTNLPSSPSSSRRLMDRRPTALVISSYKPSNPQTPRRPSAPITSYHTPGTPTNEIITFGSPIRSYPTSPTGSTKSPTTQSTNSYSPMIRSNSNSSNSSGHRSTDSHLDVILKTPPPFHRSHTTPVSSNTNTSTNTESRPSMTRSSRSPNDVQDYHHIVKEEDKTETHLQLPPLLPSIVKRTLTPSPFITPSSTPIPWAQQSPKKARNQLPGNQEKTLRHIPSPLSLRQGNESNPKPLYPGTAIFSTPQSGQSFTTRPNNARTRKRSMTAPSIFTLAMNNNDVTETSQGRSSTSNKQNTTQNSSSTPPRNTLTKPPTRPLPPPPPLLADETPTLLPPFNPTSPSATISSKRRGLRHVSPISDLRMYSPNVNHNIRNEGLMQSPLGRGGWI